MWVLTLTLVFGGCCANAVTLEQITSEYPYSGSLITFIQFLLISLHGLPKHIQLGPTTRWRIPLPQLKPRKIPITTYLIQVALFYLISLLNNAAFGYNIPMAVHIIFRSGGLIVSMLLGWTVAQQRYTLTQVISVLLVTLGVILTTLSASNQDSKPEFHPDAATYNIRTYGMGIAILSLALLLSGLLGMVQDKTYAKYGRPLNASVSQSEMDKSGKQKNTAVSDVPAWQESMFYLHFLALPMFISVRHDLLEQFRSVSAGSRIYISIPHVIPSSLSSLLCPSTSSTSPLILPLPRMAIPLLLNTVTQLLCVAGVHRLTTRVSSLTVTLVLVVRKAVSFVLSVLWLRGRGGGATLAMMWIGAALVMLGTVGYALGRGVVVKEGKDKDE